MEQNLVEVKIKGELHIVVAVKYNLGGYSCFSMQKNARGYYLSVIPMQIKGDMYSFSAYSGYRQIILEVSRKSHNNYIKALENVLQESRQLLINMITAVGLQEGLVQSNIDEVVKEAIQGIEKQLEKAKQS